MDIGFEMPFVDTGLVVALSICPEEGLLCVCWYSPLKIQFESIDQTNAMCRT